MDEPLSPIMKYLLERKAGIDDALKGDTDFAWIYRIDDDSETKLAIDINRLTRHGITVMMEPVDTPSEKDRPESLRFDFRIRNKDLQKLLDFVEKELEPLRSQLAETPTAQSNDSLLISRINALSDEKLAHLVDTLCPHRAAIAQCCGARQDYVYRWNATGVQLQVPQLLSEMLRELEIESYLSTQVGTNLTKLVIASDHLPHLLKAIGYAEARRGITTLTPAERGRQQEAGDALTEENMARIKAALGLPGLNERFFGYCRQAGLTEHEITTVRTAWRLMHTDLTVTHRTKRWSEIQDDFAGFTKTLDRAYTRVRDHQAEQVPGDTEQATQAAADLYRLDEAISRMQNMVFAHSAVSGKPGKGAAR